MKKVISVILAALTLLSMLSACAPAAEDSNKDSGTNNDANTNDVNITVNLYDDFISEMAPDNGVYVEMPAHVDSPNMVASNLNIIYHVGDRVWMDEASFAKILTALEKCTGLFTKVYFKTERINSYSGDKRPEYENTLNACVQAVEALGFEVDTAIETNFYPGSPESVSDMNLLDTMRRAMGISVWGANKSKVSDRYYTLPYVPNSTVRSNKILAADFTLAIMGGATGVTVANLADPDYDDGASTYLSGMKEMWDAMVSKGSGWKLYGGTSVPNASKGANSGEKVSHTGVNGNDSGQNTLFLSGFIPFTPYSENSVLTVIDEAMAEAMTDEQIKTALAGGVMMDGAAARTLSRRGYKELLGVTKISTLAFQGAERYLDQEFNGVAANTLRYIWGQELYHFALAEGAEALTVTETVLYYTTKNIASYVYENELGGRVAVFGYKPWEYFDIWQRTLQTRNLVEWLTKGQNPVRVLNDTNIVPFIKQPEDRSEFILSLTNAFLSDSVEDLKVRILGEYDCDMVYYDAAGNSQIISKDNITIANGYTVVTLPKMVGWDTCVLMTQK